MAGLGKCGSTRGVPLSQMSPITSPLLRDSGSVRDRSGLTTQDYFALWVQIVQLNVQNGVHSGLHVKCEQVLGVRGGHSTCTT